MISLSLDFWLLLASIILCLSLCIYLFKRNDKNKSQMRNIFIINMLCTLIISVGVLSQWLLSNLFDIDAIIFENFIYIGTCFLPVSIFFSSLIFIDTKIKFKKSYLLLFIIPILSLIILWTNNFHHLFYVKYSQSFTDTINGPYMLVHTVYSYLLLFIGIIRLLKFSIKNSGFFSKQSLLIILGFIAPLFVNVLGGVAKVIPMTVFATPIAFSISVICFTLAIFKFDFLKVAPIALQKVVDRISDSYIVVNEDNVIIDFNETFLKTFKVSSNDVRNKNLFDMFNKHNNFNIASNKLIKDSDEAIILEEYFDKIDKYFHIEINRIESKGNFLGTLILFKDITQHTIDMQTIRDNQDMLVEKERLASLGQMIGGIAHNLKTPIMSIAGAAEGLTDLIKEYDSSIGDPEVTIEDHHEIAKDMKEWIEKTKTHLSYMSDVITAIKGQAVAFSEQTSSGFTIKELINYVDILMKHELKNGLTNLKTKTDIDTSTVVKGNINSLVQVINNIISNAIQAYQEKGKSNQDINFTIYKDGNNIVFKIEDFAEGLPQKVQNKLFKEMITTKGKNGTGLGLFMSYSNIKAHFNGHMDYETEKGKGTTFYIRIPLG
jgi:signal transduction histidine kinase